MIKYICETGAAHGKSYARCLAMIDAARKTGADSIKFSAFKAEEMTVDSHESPFIIEHGAWAGISLFDLYKEIAIPYHWLGDLRKAAKAVGLKFILSIYHPNTVETIKNLGVRTVKVASFELQYKELLQEIAIEDGIHKVILSTGGATEDEIWSALEILEGKDVILLYCVPKYPPKPQEMNLKTLADMKKFGVDTGYSNHSTTLTEIIVASTMDISLIEAHMKLDDDNHDASFAVFPDKFKAIIDASKRAEMIMGSINYNQDKTYHRREIEGKMVRAVWQNAT